MTSFSSKIELPSARALVSTAASVAATAMVARSFAKDLLPAELRHYFHIKFRHFLATFSNEITLVIDEFDGLNKNQLFSAAELYASSISSPSSRTYRASLPEKEKKIRLSLGGNEEIADEYCQIQLKWKFVAQESRRHRVPNYGESFSATCEVRSFTLTFHKKHKTKVIDEYLPYVLQKSESLKEEKKTLKLYTLKSERMYGPGINSWHSVNLDHPAKFETLAMDDEMKKMILDDLDMFVKRKELYRKVGKAWKRGYLLFGPPGTGKSSLIAAMANYLKFDVYDLELTTIRCNADLRHLLISTVNRSILVVEDIDATIDLSERKIQKTAKAAPHPSVHPYYQQPVVPKVTLSGLLNFIDGLWSSIGDERIIIFTTNHKEKLDPALLRPGRMDVHIEMLYCTPCGFRLLASNYLGMTEAEHPLMVKAEELIGSSKITPAEVGEQLLKSEDPEVALGRLIKFLELRKVETERKCEEAKVDAEEWISKLEMSKSSSDGLREVMKMGKESSSGAEMDGRIVRKDDAANAVKILFGFLQQEIGNVSADSNLGALRANVQESIRGNGIKAE